MVVRQTDSGKRWLQHMGHSHQWTNDFRVAMEYTKIEGLADKMGGKVEAL